MKIYINDRVTVGKFDNITLKDILHSTKKKLNKEIINKIYINDVEVNEDLILSNSFKIEEVKEIKFETQEVNKLIQESLTEAQKYLDKVQEGLIDTAQFYREGLLDKGTNKFQLCLEGLEWYTEVLVKTLSLLEEDSNKNESLNKFNEIMSKALVLLNQGKTAELADVLEYELKDHLDNFIKLNAVLLKNNN